MNSPTLTNAKYERLHHNEGDIYISIEFDGKLLSVPIDPGNRHYAEIMRQVDAGTLTIEPADE